MAEPTVFVVDDDPAVRQSVQALLEADGFTAKSYPSSAEFLAAYSPGQRGCLLLDVCLKGSNGLDLQDELNKRGVRLAVIIITSNGDASTTARAFKAGAIDVLRKPVAPERLLQRVRQAIVI